MGQVLSGVYLAMIMPLWVIFAAWSICKDMRDRGIGSIRTDDLFFTTLFALGAALVWPLVIFAVGMMMLIKRLAIEALRWERKSSKPLP